MSFREQRLRMRPSPEAQWRLMATNRATLGASNGPRLLLYVAPLTARLPAAGLTHPGMRNCTAHTIFCLPSAQPHHTCSLQHVTGELLWLLK
jgi:hypothetical protein